MIPLCAFLMIRLGHGTRGDSDRGHTGNPTVVARTAPIGQMRLATAAVSANVVTVRAAEALSSGAAIDPDARDDFGPFAPGFTNVPYGDLAAVEAKAAALVEKARARGVTVMRAPITFAKGYNEISQHPYGILAGVVDNSAFVKGEWGAEFSDAIPISEEDIIVEGKRGLDTFASTNIDFMLRSKGIKNVILAGFLTNCCVESTMRTAYENGFNVVTVTDCCAAVSPEQHEAAIEFDFPMFSHPMTQAEVLENLG